MRTSESRCKFWNLSYSNKIKIAQYTKSTKKKLKDGVSNITLYFPYRFEIKLFNKMETSFSLKFL